MTVDIKHVSRNFGLNILRPVRVSQSVLGLVEMLTRWADTDNHHRFAVTTEGELEKSRQLRIAIRDVVRFAWVAERVDAAAQGKQRLVDVGTFPQPFSSVLSRTRTFTTSQVDDTQCCHCVRFMYISVAVLLSNVYL